MTSNRPACGILAFLLISLPFVSSCQDAANQPMTTVFVVRHAEKVDQSEDPDLSAPGMMRARLLQQMLARVPVAALYATQYKRTQQTLAPLAEEIDRPIEQFDAGQTQSLVDAIRQHHRGKVVVTAGHSNTVPSIVNALAGTDYESLSEEDYDNLFVVTISPSGSNVLQLRFGAGSH